MQTDVMCAWQVEIGDLLSFGDDITATVADIEDDGDETQIRFYMRDEDGLPWDGAVLRFPMETVHVVVSYEDDE